MIKLKRILDYWQGNTILIKALNKTHYKFFSI